MSKNWYVLLCLLTLLLVSPQVALAVPSINIGNVNGIAGQNAAVDVTLANAGSPSPVVNVSLEFAYDPTKLSGPPVIAAGAAATAASKSLSDPQITVVSATKSTLNFIIFGLNSTGIQDGVLATLTFPLSADFSGSTQVTFNVVPEVNDAEGTVVPVTTSNGSISVPDTAAPTVSTFTIASPSSSLTVQVTAFTATDNVGVTGYLITESATAPAAGAAGWSATAPTSFTFTSDGAKTLRAWAKDAAGNVSAALSANVTITLPDTTRPVVTGVTIPATSTSLTVDVTGFTATDNVAVTGYLLTETSGLPAVDAAGWSATPQTTFTFTSGGARTLFAWAKDAAGNIALSVSRSITITLPDGVAPDVTAFTVAGSATSLVVPVTSFTATDNLQVAGYIVTESATAPAAAAAGWSTTAPTSYTVTGAVPQGVATNVTLYGWAKDAAGNISASVSGIVAITLPDTTKPVVDTFTVPADATTAVVPLTLAASDNLAVTGYLITDSETAPAAADAGWTTTAPTSYAFTGLPQGLSNKTLYAWAKDAAGNVSLSKSAAIAITLTGPTITLTNMLSDGAVTKNTALTIAGSVNGNGTALSSLTLSVNDATPEALAFDPTTGAFQTAIVLVEGANKLVIAATDANTNVTTDTRTITLDPNAADLAVTSPTNSSFTTNALVDVTGTVGSPQSTTVTIALNDGAAETVALNGGNSFTFQLTLVKGPNTIVVTATDTVPHTQSILVTYDPDAPVLSVSSPADAFATPKSSVVLTGAVEDALTTPALTVSVDGVALSTQPVITDGAFSVTIDLPTVKTYAITVAATDLSGNSSSITRNVIRKDPSGNATDGISAPTIADVQKVLQFALGLATPTADEVINVDVAPLASGKPAPDGNVDGGDALVILEKVVGIVTW